MNVTPNNLAVNFTDTRESRAILADLDAYTLARVIVWACCGWIAGVVVGGVVLV